MRRRSTRTSTSRCWRCTTATRSTRLGHGADAGRGRGRGPGHRPRRQFRARADGHTGARGRGDIGFATLRGGNVVGEHSVIFAARASAWSSPTKPATARSSPRRRQGGALGPRQGAWPLLHGGRARSLRFDGTHPPLSPAQPPDAGYPGVVGPGERGWAHS